MAIENVYGLPGFRSPRTASHRVILAQGDYTYLAQGGVIDGTTSRDPGNTGDIDVLRAGLLMGILTSGGQWSPSILGVTSNAEAVGATTLETSAAVATELVRRVGATGTFKLTGPPTAGGVVVTETVTYSAVNTSTGAITATAIANAFVAGSFIQPTDGAETPVSFIPDGYGIKVTDQDGTSVDVEFPQIPVSGVLDSSMLLPAWPSDAALRQWIVNRLNDAAAGKFVFDHTYGR